MSGAGRDDRARRVARLKVRRRGRRTHRDIGNRQGKLAGTADHDAERGYRRDGGSLCRGLLGSQNAGRVAGIAEIHLDDVEFHLRLLLQIGDLCRCVGQLGLLQVAELVRNGGHLGLQRLLNAGRNLLVLRGHGGDLLDLRLRSLNSSERLRLSGGGAQIVGAARLDVEAGIFQRRDPVWLQARRKWYHLEGGDGVIGRLNRSVEGAGITGLRRDRCIAQLERQAAEYGAVLADLGLGGAVGRILLAEIGRLLLEDADGRVLGLRLQLGDLLVELRGDLVADERQAAIGLQGGVRGIDGGELAHQRRGRRQDRFDRARRHRRSPNGCGAFVAPQLDLYRSTLIYPGKGPVKNDTLGTGQPSASAVLFCRR